MTHDLTPEDPPEPPRIRGFRRLVTALTLTMIFGMIAIVVLLTWRILTPLPLPALPTSIDLPPGERLTGFAHNADWTVLITTDDAGQQRLHLVPAGTTGITQTVPIEAAPSP